MRPDDALRGAPDASETVLKGLLVASTGSIRESLALINRNVQGMILVVAEDGRLVGTVTDGDIRRGLLRGLTLDACIDEVANKNPIVCPPGLARQTLLNLMRANSVRHLPIVDEAGRVVAVESLETQAELSEDRYSVVVMAGGEGRRLRPLTDTLPKPMLPVGGRPLVEILLRSLGANGFRQAFLNVRYLGHVIEQHFGDGSRLGLDIRFLREPKPMGTAGGLGLIPHDLRPTSAFLVVNGDVLTTLPFSVLRDFHVAAGYVLTMCGRPFEVTIPFGYPVTNGDLVVDFREKPTFTYLVNSGIYCLNPEVLDLVPANESLDMPDLIRRVAANGGRVGLFPLREPFHEIGRVDSYQAAEEFYRRHFPAAEQDRVARS